MIVQLAILILLSITFSMYVSINTAIDAIAANIQQQTTNNIIYSQVKINQITASKLTDTIVATLNPKNNNSIPPVDLSKALTYEDCIRHALLQSPYFLKGTIQIEVERISERDAHWKMLPDINIDLNCNFMLNNLTRYTSSPFKVNFIIGNWDPIQAYLSIAVYKLLTKIAMYKHLKVIAESLLSIADAFLQLEYIDKAATLINEEIALTKREKIYTMNRYQNGQASNLDILTVNNKIDRLTIKDQQNANKRLEILKSLKKILGIPLNQTIIVQLQNSLNQVLGSFDPTTATLNTAQCNSIGLKIKTLEKEVQRYNIIATYAQYIPKIQLGFRTEYSTYNNLNSDIFVSNIGFTTPLWDWGARWRNIKREKHKMRREEIDAIEKELDLKSDWYKSEIERNNLAGEMKLAYSTLELIKIKKQQVEIHYKSGTECYVKYIESLKDLYDAQIATLTAELQYNEAILKLRHITGDLYRSYIDATSL